MSSGQGAKYAPMGHSSNTSLLSPNTPGSKTGASPSLRSVGSSASLFEAADRLSKGPSVSDKFALSPDPSEWNLSPDGPEDDDAMHNPDPRRDHKNDSGGSVFTTRGIANLGCLAILATGLIGLFAGYPLASYFTTTFQSTGGGFNLGGINSTGQVPEMSHGRGVIDVATPREAYTKASYHTGEELQLVFSDEFNEDGRTFYPGDDPYWTAEDLHYWGTNNLEWYDPRQVTTKDGNLEVTLTEMNSHGLNYEGGLVTTWNKFCFTGGLIETSLILPGDTHARGLWPAVWTMGNLGRAGYGASLDGMWPYSYDSCDVGTVANQTIVDASGARLPIAATTNGDPQNPGSLSFLPGQRLSRCTCPGSSHPGPIHADGSYVGRAAPEIDIIEAQVGGGPVEQRKGHVSQSGQWAPFTNEYRWPNETNIIIPDHEVTELNTYLGGAFQQSTSGVSITNQGCYEGSPERCYSVYGFEYKPGFDAAYITWINDGKIAWTLLQPGMGPDSKVEIDARPVPQEPLYIIANLGISPNFGDIDFDMLTWPAVMRIDYIRVYQPKGAINVGCDPVDFPTAAYIEQYYEAYTQPNLTTWEDDYKQVIPGNSFLGQC